MAQADANQNVDAPSTKPDSSGFGMPFTSERPYLLLALCVIITIALYLPHLATVFVDWDLVAYRFILYTTDYWNTAVRLFTDFQGKLVTGYYAPIASISLMMDKWFVGSNQPSAWFTLLLNLLLHCLNGILVCFVLRAISASRNVAILAALIFLIHPVQVSSVLWFSQRKGLLATALYLLAYLGYLRYADRRALGPYLGSLASFVIALLTKPTVVVLPLALLAWQVIISVSGRSLVPEPGLERKGIAPSGEIAEKMADTTRSGTFRRQIVSLVRTVLPLLPFFVAALASGLAAMQSEGISMDVEGPPDVPVLDRPFIAASAIWFYIDKALAPMGLSPIYPRWDVDIHQVVWWLPLLALVALFAVLIRYRHHVGAVPLWCILNFLIPLLPVLGLVKFGYLRLSYVADHFMYLPMVGMAGFLAVCIEGARLYSLGRVRSVATIFVVTYLAFFGFQTWSYGSAWKDSVTFWSYNLEHNPRSWAAHTYLGHALISAGRPADAFPHFERTISLKRAYIDDRLDRAHRLEQAGRQSEAKRYLTQAANLEKTLAIGYYNIGNALLHANRHAQAIELYKKALELQPKLVKALTNIGVCYIALNDFPKAEQQLTSAAELSPNNFEAQYNLGYVLRMLGQRSASDKHFAKARSLRPNVPLPEFPNEGSAGRKGR